MSQTDGKAADAAPVETRKRSASSSSPQESSSSGRSSSGQKRARTEDGGKESQGSEVDEWDLLQEKLNDVLAGRADDNLDEWAASWSELCDVMAGRDKLKNDEQKLMKEIGRELKRSARLERNLGMRK